MAKLTFEECRKTAGRRRPWTFRLEFHGTTPNGNPSAKFWYATGRGLDEAVEIGWGAIGQPPSHQLIDWAELRPRVEEKLRKGYDYAPTDYVRMSAANLAKLTNSPPPPAPPVQTSPDLSTLGEPFSLIQSLKIIRDGTKIVGYAAMDKDGDELLQFDAVSGLDFATEYDLEIVFG